MKNFATAHAMKKRAKKMASGGKVADGYEDIPLKEAVTGGMPQMIDYDEKPKLIKKAYARGGFVEEEKASGYEDHAGDDIKPNRMAIDEDDRMLNQHGEVEEGPIGGAYAKGGMIEDNYQPETHSLDMVGRVMKQYQKMFSRGGVVANDTGTGQEADKLPNQYDDLVLRNDDMEDADYTEENSGDEIGNAGEDERRKDIVSRIMRSRAKKDRMPRPA